MAETLVSILISSLALLMLATAIGSSVNIVIRSRNYMSDYYEEESSMIGGSSTPGTIELDIAMVNNGGSLEKNISIDLHKTDSTGLIYYERSSGTP